MDGMHGMEGMAPPSDGPSPPSNQHHHAPMTMMHMTFFWGTHAEILFSGWPGRRTGMYALALVFVFVLSVLVEWLSHCHLIKDGASSGSGGGGAAAGLARTAMHGLRIALAYVVMLALMSFNVGVFLVAVGGHAFGFFLFGSRVFRKSTDCEKGSDLPPLSC